MLYCTMPCCACAHVASGSCMSPWGTVLSCPTHIVSSLLPYSTLGTATSQQQGHGCLVQVMDLVELRSLAQAVVGRPGVDGLSVEQRKRLTIAVELVANPSIVFMDEPTSG